MFLWFISGALSYTVLYNLLNFPAGVVPVSTVTTDDEAQLDNYKGNFGDPWDKFFVKVSFSRHSGDGLPNAKPNKATLTALNLTMIFAIM